MWSLGSGDMPFSPTMMCEPPSSAVVLTEVEDWMQKLGLRIEHDKGTLQTKETIYDCPRLPGVCCADPRFKEACNLLEHFMKVWPKRRAGDIFLIIAEGIDMFAFHVHGGPSA